jgi:hypothetical protein
MVGKSVVQKVDWLVEMLAEKMEMKMVGQKGDLWETRLE